MVFNQLELVISVSTFKCISFLESLSEEMSSLIILVSWKGSQNGSHRKERRGVSG